MDKKTLRKVYLEKRRLLTDAEYKKRNLFLCDRLKALVQKNGYQRIHLFFPIKKFKEVDLHLFLAWAYAQPNIQIITSVSDLATAQMQHYTVNQQTSFAINEWGIPEPVGAKEFNIKGLDCVLVPMVIGSKTGQRIGYGKGYYDQFLMQCTEKTVFVGLNLGPLLEGAIFTEGHDISMDWMMTPFQLLKC